MSLKSLALKLSVPVFLAVATASSGALAHGPYDRDHRDVSVNVYVRKAPPPVRYERIPPRSYYGDRAAWVPGHWGYNRGDYHWVRGAYRSAPNSHARWREGRWEHKPQGWVYFSGSWR